VAIHKDRNANVKKGDWYKTVDASTGDFSVQTVIDKKEHTFRRRLLAPAFSETALRDQEQFIDQSVCLLLKQMTKEIGEDGWTVYQDFSEWLTYYGFDFISDISFGSRFNLLEEPEHRYLPELLKMTSHFLYYVRIGAFHIQVVLSKVAPDPRAVLLLLLLHGVTLILTSLIGWLSTICSCCPDGPWNLNHGLHSKQSRS
jgi:hypothetical protein